MNCCKALAWAFAMEAFSLSAANIWYVDNSVPTDVYDGTSPVVDGTHGPKRIIQSAIGLAASGDTILVAPGVYGDEQGSLTSTLAVRAVIPSDKSLTVKSSGGKDVTHIVGRFADTDAKSGSGAIGGFMIERANGGVSHGSRIEGFTFRNCATSLANRRGGAVSMYPDTGDNCAISEQPWVVDCVISNCVSIGMGILGNVNCARVLVNRVKASTANGTACGFNVNAIHSVFAHGGDSSIAVAQGRFVNCSFADFGNRTTSSAAPRLFANCIDQGGLARYDDDVNSVYANSVVQAARLQNGKGQAIDMVWGKTDGQMMAPALDDFRPVGPHALVADTAYAPAAANAGDERWLAEFPEEFRYVDFSGKRFVPSNGNVQAGAVQELAIPVCGVKLCYGVKVDGHDVPIRSTIQYAYYDVWPKVCHLDHDRAIIPNIFCYRYDTSDSPYTFKFPTKGDEALFTPIKGTVLELKCMEASRELYVDANEGSESGTGSAASPFLTLQQAVNVSPGNCTTLVHVAKGVYDKGGDKYGSTYCRVNIMSGTKRFRFVADEGPEETVIMGAEDREAGADAHGCGPNAYRCIGAMGASCFQGFTLTGGRVAATSGGYTATLGGTVYTDSKTIALVGCIVSNNVAVRGSAMYNGSAYGCRFYDCPVFTSEMFAGSPTVAFCEIGPQTVYSGAGNMGFFEKGAILSHLTLCNTNSNMTLYSAHGYLFNSIISHSRFNSNNAGQLRVLGNVFWDFEYNIGVDKGFVNTNFIHYVKVDPQFVDDEGGDRRLMAGSPAIGYGNAWNGLGEMDDFAQYDNYYSAMSHDPLGHEPYFVDGRPTAGAYQRPGKVRLPVAPKGSTLTGPNGATAVEFDGVTTVTLAGGARQVHGLTLMGEPTDSLSAMIVPSELTDASGVLQIGMQVATNWWVDAVGGRDANNGWTATTAKRTLAAVMENADAGDVVTALPGTYEDGEMKHTTPISAGATVYLPSRVVVPSGVSLVSRDGFGTTIIKGRYYAAGRFGFLGGDEQAGEMMRCVTLNPRTELKGFTLVDGGTFSNKCVKAWGVDNQSGGGALALESGAGAQPTVSIRDCFFLNCGAACGGGVRYGAVENCRFKGTMASEGYGGAAADCGRFNNCIVDECRAAVSVDEPLECVGTTFGKNNHAAGGNGQEGIGVLRMTDAQRKRLENCLFLGGHAGIPVSCPVRDCIVPTADYLAAPGTAVRENVIIAQVELDDDYVPTKDSVAVDAIPLKDCAEHLSGTDYFGNPRVCNGAMDIGAIEYDWRGEYARLLGSRRLTVVAASPEVVAAADGVTVPGGAKLAAVYTAPGDGEAVTFANANDNAVLNLSVNGSERTIAASGVNRVGTVSGENEFLFAADGAGGVTLSAFRRDSGLMIFVR